MLQSPKHTDFDEFKTQTCSPQHAKQKEEPKECYSNNKAETFTKRAGTLQRAHLRHRKM